MKPKSRTLLTLIVALAFIAVACGSDDDSDSGSDLPATSEPTTNVDDSSADDSGSTSGSASALRVTEVDFAAGVATISNTSTDAIDLTGHWLCNRPAYVELPGQSLAAGETLEVSLGGVTQGGGEVGLYTSGSFGSSDDMVDYVTWGSGGGRLSVAEGAGLWSGDSAAAGDETLSLQGDGGAAASWG